MEFLSSCLPINYCITFFTSNNCSNGEWKAFSLLLFIVIMTKNIAIQAKHNLYKTKIGVIHIFRFFQISFMLLNKKLLTHLDIYFSLQESESKNHNLNIFSQHLSQIVFFMFRTELCEFYIWKFIDFIIVTFRETFLSFRSFNLCIDF